MVFHIISFTYLSFYSAAWNALTFWKVIEIHNCWGPHRIGLSHWVVRFIQLMSLIGTWTKVTRGLKHVVLGIHPFAPFTYRGMIELLIQIEDELGH